MAAQPLDPAALIGTWRLIHATSVGADGSARRPPYGPCPMGRLILSSSGRMMAVICDGRTEMPEGEPRGYASYCGNFVVEGNLLITTVDAALVADRIGGKQHRHAQLIDGKLVLRPPERADGEQRELIWERDGPA